MASDGSETVPKRLATDLFLGALPSALNEELLRMLCISHIIVFAPALDEPSTSSDGGFAAVTGPHLDSGWNAEAGTPACGDSEETELLAGTGLCIYSTLDDLANFAGQVLDKYDLSFSASGVLSARGIDDVAGGGGAVAAGDAISADKNRCGSLQPFSVGRRCALRFWQLRQPIRRHLRSRRLHGVESDFLLGPIISSGIRWTCRLNTRASQQAR